MVKYDIPYFQSYATIAVVSRKFSLCDLDRVDLAIIQRRMLLGIGATEQPQLELVPKT